MRAGVPRIELMGPHRVEVDRVHEQHHQLGVELVHDGVDEPARVVADPRVDRRERRRVSEIP
jgi:hypothetical protein